MFLMKFIADNNAARDVLAAGLAVPACGARHWPYGEAGHARRLVSPSRSDLSDGNPVALAKGEDNTLYRAFSPTGNFFILMSGGKT